MGQKGNVLSHSVTLSVCLVLTLSLFFSISIFLYLYFSLFTSLFISLTLSLSQTIIERGRKVTHTRFSSLSLTFSPFFVHSLSLSL